MEVESAVRKMLLADPTVSGYVGAKVYKFRLETVISGTGGRAVVVKRDGGWAAPDTVKTSEFPSLIVECWADAQRDARGEVEKANAEESAYALYRAVDPLLHAKRGVWWGGGPSDGLLVVTCARMSEPLPVVAGSVHGGEQAALIGDGAFVTTRYAVQLAHGR